MFVLTLVVTDVLFCMQSEKVGWCKRYFEMVAGCRGRKSLPPDKSDKMATVHITMEGPARGAAVGPAAKNSRAIKSATDVVHKSSTSVFPTSAMASAAATASFKKQRCRITWRCAHSRRCRRGKQLRQSGCCHSGALSWV